MSADQWVSGERTLALDLLYVSRRHRVVGCASATTLHEQCRRRRHCRNEPGQLWPL